MKLSSAINLEIVFFQIEGMGGRPSATFLWFPLLRSLYTRAEVRLLLPGCYMVL
jgi:hypothetical protein